MIRSSSGVGAFLPVEGARGQLGEIAGEVIVVQLLRSGALDGEGGRADAGARQGVHGARAAASPGLAGEALARSESDEQHARGGEPRHVREQQCLAAASGEVSAGHGCGDPPAGGVIERTRLGCQLRLIEHPDGDALDGELGQSLRPDVKIHSRCSFRATLARAALAPL